jgi:hypothetical protein
MPPLPPLAACCAVPLPSSSSYLSPHTPFLSCSRPPLPSFLLLLLRTEPPRAMAAATPVSVGSHHQPLPALLDPCRTSPLPTGAPRSHPGANPSPDGPTDVRRRSSSIAASASPPTRPSSSSHPSPITPAGPHHLEEAPGPAHRASSTLNMPEHHRRDQALPPLALLRPPRLQPSPSKGSSRVPHASPPLPRRQKAPHHQNRAP